MTVNTRATEATTTAEPLDILALYRTMVTARVTNDLLKTRKTQGKFPFYIGCAGHESMAAVAATLNPDDWMSLYYRDLGAWLQRTGDIYGPLREAYSRTTGPMGAGRNMPSHYSNRRKRILPTFSEVGALAPFAGGVGFAGGRQLIGLAGGLARAFIAGQGAAQRRLDPLGKGREIGLAVERDIDRPAHQRGAAERGQDRARKPLDGDAAAVDQTRRCAIDKQWRFVAEFDRL